MSIDLFEIRKNLLFPCKRSERNQIDLLTSTHKPRALTFIKTTQSQMCPGQFSKRLKLITPDFL